MTFARPPRRSRPKISTMPRQQSEASQYLDIYKLAVEKKRLKQELASLDARRDRIQERLNMLEQQIADLDHTAQRFRETGKASEPNSIIYPPAPRPDARNGQGFQTVTLDY